MEDMKKVLFVATVVKTHIMEFHIPYLKMFKDNGWETAVAARNDYDNLADCNIPYCDTFFDFPFERSPFSPNNVSAYFQLKKIIDSGNYDIIHCHTPVGAALTRLAARAARKKGTKVIYTAHGFHFYKGAPLLNWLIYYPIERFLARFTDVLITINQEDYNRAKSFKAGKVEYVAGVGIDLKRFSRNQLNRDDKRKELGLSKEDFLLLSVGELIDRKNHAIVIEALEELKKRGIIDRVHYLLCGQGLLAEQLKKQVVDLGLEKHVHFLGYRNDIDSLCNCSDAFVFMSEQEGLPVALMEAMACGLPIICSRIRGNTDLIRNRENGLFADNNPFSVADAIESYMSNERLKSQCAEQAIIDIKKYDISQILKDMNSIYSSAVEKTPVE